jgi:hypothetical protein
MPTELTDALRALAGEWETAAPTITVDEATRARSISDEVPPTSPEVTVVGGAPRPSRWWIAVAAAAAVALVIVAVTVLRRGDPDRRIEPPQESDITASTAAPTSTAASTTVATTVDESFATMLDQVTAARAALDGFTATVTLTTSNPTVDATGAPLPPNVVTSTDRVVMLAEGSLWSEGDRFLWSSFDPTTGTARNAVVGADGLTQYQEWHGWADASVPINILFGTDPLADVASFAPTALPPGTTTQVEQVTSDLGREAWRVRFVERSGGTTNRVMTWDFDRGTGIVVAYSDLTTYNGVDQTTDMQITSLSTDAALPDEFPGAFPDGAAVDRGGDPSRYVPMSVPDAAAVFGGTIYVPDDFGDDAVATVTDSRPEDNSTMRQLEIRRRVGFTTVSVTMSKFLLDPGAPIPAGAQVIDGAFCSAPAGNPCEGGPGGTTITSGALAGVSWTVEANWVVATVAGVTVVVRAPTLQAAIAAANSLVQVDPPN